MADFPAIPLWTDAYLADTRHLSTVEHGAYLLLLMEAWRRPTRSLPDDDKLLARLAGLSEAEWLAIRDVIMAFWKRDGRSRTWSQKRLSLEATYVAKKSKSQRDNAAKRWNKTEKADAVAMPNGCQTDAPTPTPTPTPTVIEDISPTTPVEGAPAGADDAEKWDAVSLADHVARVGGVRHLEPGRIASNISTVREWLDAGADPPMIAAVVQAGRDSARMGIHSLAYFDARVRQAIANRDHPNDRNRPSLDTIRDPLLRKYLENGGTLETRAATSG